METPVFSDRQQYGTEPTISLREYVEIRFEEMEKRIAMQAHDSELALGIAKEVADHELRRAERLQEQLREAERTMAGWQGRLIAAGAFLTVAVALVTVWARLTGKA